MSIYYNEDRKYEFLNVMIEADKPYVNSYQRLFRATKPFEEMHRKDLAMFSSKDLLMVFKEIAWEIKYTTALSYNSLIDDYKEWVYKRHEEVVDEVCSVKELKSIKDFKQYVIYNDNDILNITKYAELDGGDYNIVLALKLFWDIDGQEDILDLLKLKVQDIDNVQHTVTIHRSLYKYENRQKTFIGMESHTYKIEDEDNWTIEALLDYAEWTEISFKRKRGSYDILSAEQNDGLIFRMTKTNRTKVGEPIDGIKFSNTLYQFCLRHRLETITINDILASLALRYMIKNKKSPAEMYTEARYFANTPSSVYAEIFKEYAEKKYPRQFVEYVDFYHNLQKTISKK